MVEHNPREQNTRVDLLSKLASTKRAGIYKTVIQETLVESSIQLEEVMANEEIDREWMIEIWNYLKHDILPDDGCKARKIKLQASYYSIDAGILYR